MTKRMLIMLLIVGVILGGIVGFNLFKGHMLKKFMASNAEPPATVSATRVQLQEWQPQLAAIGSLRAVRGVDVTSEIAGLVSSIHFKSGDDVTSGQVLVQLNADSDVAQQRALEAAAELSATVYERDAAQYKAQAVSKATLDSDAADLKSKRAQVAQQAAIVAKKTIRAPFAGRLGISTVNPGQYINPGDKIVTLQAIDPIYVDFSLPQRELSRVSVGQTVTVVTDAYKDRHFEGKITAISPQVDSDTRNVQLEATIENTKHELLPGLFADISVDIGASERHLTLPQTAITYNPYGATVFVAKASGHRDAQGHPTMVAEQVFVTTGVTRGDQVAVLKGIEAGARVVTSGQLKLKNGTPLIIDNRIQPSSSPNPTPQEH